MHVRSPRVLLLSICLAAFTGRMAAQQPVLFTEPPSSHELTTSIFTDADIDRLTDTLQRAMAVPAGSTDPTADPELQLWKFTKWLQTGQLSPEQETRITDRLGALSQQFPARAPMLQQEQRTVKGLTIGKTAPEIVGHDLDGQEFRLSDYRGKVVVLTFSGDWCGICRAQYPYQRLLQDLYKDQPFAIVSVNSDNNVDAARRGKVKAGLTYRSWWDGYGDSRIEGPIARLYNVYGWPTTYVLDERGVIRFVDLRQEDLLKGVRQLMDDLEQKIVLAQNQTR
jgi:peroxiredoxin